MTPDNLDLTLNGKRCRQHNAFIALYLYAIEVENLEPFMEFCALEP